jgi:hypothetical protein
MPGEPESPPERVPRLRMGTPDGALSPGFPPDPGSEFPPSLQAKGRITRASAKRHEIRCTRGAFHR